MASSDSALYVFRVVEFLEDQRCSVVSNTWIYEEDREVFCWWPPQQYSVKKLMMEHKKPNQAKWKSYKVRVFPERFHSYARADNAVAHYSQTSDGYEEGDREVQQLAGQGTKRRRWEEGNENDGDEEDDISDRQHPPKVRATSPLLTFDTSLSTEDESDVPGPSGSSMKDVETHRCISHADAQKIINNQEVILRLLEELSRKQSGRLDVEEEVEELLPHKCATLNELLDLDQRITGGDNLPKHDKLLFKKRRELLKQYLMAKAAGEREVKPALRRVLEAIAEVGVLAKLSKCGQTRKSGTQQTEGKTSLQAMTIFTIIIRALRAKDPPFQQSEVEAHIVDVLKAYPKRKAVKQASRTLVERPDSSDDEQ